MDPRELADLLGQVEALPEPEIAALSDRAPQGS
jgi:hypothetical protein